MDTSDDLIAAARSLRPLIHSCRDESERIGRTSPAVVDALAKLGLFRSWLPKALGGYEADPATLLAVISEISSADGSAGWNLMNGATYGLMSFYLPESVSRAIYCAPGSVTAGQIAPNGRAVAVDGGYRVSGNWGFGSGIHHATWIASGCTIYDGDVPRASSTGSPERLHVMTPIADAHVDFDSWHVSGLRGTGSCDYAMEDVFVPSERSFTFFVSRRFHPGPLSLLPRTMFAICISGVIFGITRAAIDAFTELAATRTASGTNALLRDRPETQLSLGRAEALLGAAQAYVSQTTDDVWRACLADHEPTIEQRLRLRAASVSAPQMCIQAVDVIWKAAGAASIRESFPIERCFRDVHAAAQHFSVSEPMLADTGRALLGLEPQIVPF